MNAMGVRFGYAAPNLYPDLVCMRTLHERRRQGEEICKQYRSISGADRYARAADAIADILLAVAENENEARKILRAAEIDYSGGTEAEGFFSEG